MAPSPTHTCRHDNTAYIHSKAAQPFGCLRRVSQTAIGRSDGTARQRRTVIRIGTAGWAIPRACANHFPEAGSSLQRYATRLNAVEINSTFHRPHRPETFAQWAEAVPAGFRFSVKLPRAITHQQRLLDPAGPLADFIDSIRHLEDRLGALLVQLPPSLMFDAEIAGAFFRQLRDVFEGPVVCEPRHPTWFEAEPDELLRREQVGRVGADPARVLEAAAPGGWTDLAYWRLHGSPRMYYSDYDGEFLADLASTVCASAASQIWCVFDNTASGAALGNALTLGDQLRRHCHVT
jgi:uncharacterized protein YecE (DUF72 family)